MAQNTHISLPSGAWTLLTNADVTSITFQNVSQNYIWIKGAAGAVEPTNISGALRYDFSEGEANVSLADLFPGITGPTRIYAFPGDEAGGSGAIMVSHQ